MEPRPSCVVVTGFGPFRQHLVNSSWEAVKELSKLGLGRDTDVELRTLQLPVDYREVKRRVIRIWEDLQPQLTVHVGMDAAARAVVLEQRGRNRCYRETYVRGFRPEDGGACVPGGPEVIESRVNMKAVRRRVAVEGVEVLVSRDAGRYVCDYAYYLSLHLGGARAALIHVPPSSPGLPASLLGQALQVLIREMLVQEDEGDRRLDMTQIQVTVQPLESQHVGVGLTGQHRCSCADPSVSVGKPCSPEPPVPPPLPVPALEELLQSCSEGMAVTVPQ